MTPNDVTLLAAWPPCPMPLPSRVDLGNGRGLVTDVPLHLSTQVDRLESTCPLLRALAREALDTFIARVGLGPA